MAVNFSATRLLHARTPAQAEASLRDDSYDWGAVLDRAVERLDRDVPAGAGDDRKRHVEILLVGTNEVPAVKSSSAALCARFRARGMRVNAVLVGASAAEAAALGDSGPALEENGWTIVEDSPGSSTTWYEDDEAWGMVRLARETGGLVLWPDEGGRLAVHQLFGEMFRRWGEAYWNSSARIDSR